MIQSEAIQHRHATAWTVVHLPAEKGGKMVVARFRSEIGALEYAEQLRARKAVVVPPREAQARPYREA